MEPTCRILSSNANSCTLTRSRNISAQEFAQFQTIKEGEKIFFNSFQEGWDVSEWDKLSEHEKNEWKEEYKQTLKDKPWKMNYWGWEMPRVEWKECFVIESIESYSSVGKLSWNFFHPEIKIIYPDTNIQTLEPTS